MAVLRGNRAAGDYPAWRCAAMAAVACLVLLCPPPLAAQHSGNGGQEFSEYDIKAAFLLNFAKFVEWPEEAFPEPDSPVLIGILGTNPFGETLAHLADEQNLDGRAIRIRQSDDIEELTACQVVFASRDDSTGDLPALDALAELPVLTVGEQADFAAEGGVINFVVVKTKVKFEINVKAAERANLKLSSRLLKLAVKVYK